MVAMEITFFKKRGRFKGCAEWERSCLKELTLIYADISILVPVTL